MSFAEMSRADRVAYFNFHGAKIDGAWAEFVAQYGPVPAGKYYYGGVSKKYVLVIDLTED